MTESEWLESADPVAMLKFFDEHHRWRDYVGNPLPAKNRKLRLFAVACCRSVFDGVTCRRCQGHGFTPYQGGHRTCRDCHGTGRTGGLTAPRSRRAVEIAERYADGEATWDEVVTAHEGARRAQEQAGREWPEILAMYVCGTDAGQVARSMTEPGRDISPITGAALLRDVCGNPFHDLSCRKQSCSRCGMACGGLSCGGDANRWYCVTCSDHAGQTVYAAAPLDAWLAWNGGTAPRLAAVIYSSGDFSLLSILADALEDSGCSDAAILAHARSAGPHVKGCWLVDLLLGKS